MSQMQKVRTSKQGVLVSLIALIVFLPIGACVLQQPRTFDERYAVALIELTEFRKAGTEALRAGIITADDAASLATIEDNARGLLDGAKTAHDLADGLTAENKLALASSLLTNLQAYVREQGVKSK